MLSDRQKSSYFTLTSVCLCLLFLLWELHYFWIKMGDRYAFGLGKITAFNSVIQIVMAHYKAFDIGGVVSILLKYQRETKFVHICRFIASCAALYING